jgi:hypothetical protein
VLVAVGLAIKNTIILMLFAVVIVHRPVVARAVDAPIILGGGNTGGGERDYGE